MKNFLSAPFAVVGITLGVLAAVSSITALGSEPNISSACVNPSSGEIKIVKPGFSCGDDRVSLSWGQVGPQGRGGLPDPRFIGGGSSAVPVRST